ncbi:hypothetical protein GCM10010156_45730 [Planobispora rosea]|uniref:Uncharacterized protein n=1 Tax=Planobispora rosea TaxID=35762 RepID=A0A8J3S6W4_PLARO|nr:hypothetical protein [Planobispora rosea]GGS81855.1 hypothetical protein GCM10010156_45730 [Planobispora rosea]GIH86094.1 hypothetical protein Pro02_45020 [Planobispora rosea]
MTSVQIPEIRDSGAGTLTRRDRRRFTVAGCAGLVLVAMGLLLWQAGVPVPRFSASTGGHQEKIPDSGSEWSDPLLVQEERTVVNDGFLPVTVEALTAHGRGLAPSSVTARDGRGFPRVLGAGEELPVMIDYAVTDCGTAVETIGLRVRVERWWGTAEVEVPLAEEDSLWSTTPVASACEHAEHMAERSGR